MGEDDKKRFRFWVCPSCGRVYIINLKPGQRIEGVRIRIGNQETLLDVSRIGQPVCDCGKPLGDNCLNVHGLTIDSV